MKQEILNLLKKLGGDISNAKGGSSYEDLRSVTFDTVLYDKFYDDFEVSGLEGFYNENKELYLTDKDAFCAKLIEKHFCLTAEGMYQNFWTAKMFTPFKEGTEDYKEWNDYFSGNDPLWCANLAEFNNVTPDEKPDFMLLFESCGFPDHYYICLSDPNPENPTVFGTDHEEFFKKISNCGSLLDFLKNFIPKDEFIKIAIEDIEKFYRK